MHFLHEELVPVYALADHRYEERPIIIDEGSGGYQITLRRDPDTEEKVYFRGSLKYHILIPYGEKLADVSECRNTNTDQVIFIEDFRGDPDPNREFFTEKAIQNKIDIRIICTPDGSDTNYITTFYRDGRFEKETLNYKDYMWNFPMPYGLNPDSVY